MPGTAMQTREKMTIGIALLAASTESPIRLPSSVKTGMPSDSSLKRNERLPPAQNRNI